MHDLNTSELESVCGKFVIASQGVVSWKWDSRFETALAEFPVDHTNRVRAIVERYLTTPWNSVNIGKAPRVVQMIAKRHGGLRSGQMLFVWDPNQDVFMYGAWWPWGNGKTISLRVAPHDKKVPHAEMPEIIDLFKGWFGL